MGESSTGHPEQAQKQAGPKDKGGSSARGTQPQDVLRQTKLPAFATITRRPSTDEPKLGAENGQKGLEVRPVDSVSQSGRSGASRISDVERQLEDVKNGQAEMLQMLKSLTVGQRTHVAPVAETRQRPQPSNAAPPHRRPSERAENAPLPNQVSEPSTSQLMYMLHEDSVQSRYMQAAALVKPLKGDEGRTNLRSYFDNYECLTHGWSSRRRAHLLAPHLEGRARLIYDTLSEGEKEDYETIRERIETGGANTISLRNRAKNELMSGLRQERGESLMDFGFRVLRTVRDSMLPNTPEDVIDDVASGHLLRCIGDPVTQQILLSEQGRTFHQLLDQAVTLRESYEAAFGPQRARQPPPRREAYYPQAQEHQQRQEQYAPRQPFHQSQERCPPTAQNVRRIPQVQRRLEPQQNVNALRYTPRTQGLATVTETDQVEEMIRQIVQRDVPGNEVEPRCPAVISHASPEPCDTLTGEHLLSGETRHPMAPTSTAREPEQSHESASQRNDVSNARLPNNATIALCDWPPNARVPRNGSPPSQRQESPQRRCRHRRRRRNNEDGDRGDRLQRERPAEHESQRVRREEREARAHPRIREPGKHGQAGAGRLAGPLDDMLDLGDREKEGVG